MNEPEIPVEFARILLNSTRFPVNSHSILATSHEIIRFVRVFLTRNLVNPTRCFFRVRSSQKIATLLSRTSGHNRHSFGGKIYLPKITKKKLIFLFDTETLQSSFLFYFFIETTRFLL